MHPHLHGMCTVHCVCMQVSVEFARELHAASAAAGVSFLDAPVSGGPEGAANGSLSIMVGGSEARSTSCPEGIAREG